MVLEIVRYYVRLWDFERAKGRNKNDRQGKCVFNEEINS